MLCRFIYKSIEMFTIVNKLDATIHIHARIEEKEEEDQEKNTHTESMGKMLIGCGWISFVCSSNSSLFFSLVHFGTHIYISFFPYYLLQMIE